MRSIQFYKDGLKKFLQDRNIDCDDIIIINPRDISVSSEFPTFKDIFEYLTSPYDVAIICPGSSIGPIDIAPITNGSGDTIGYYRYGISRLQYRVDTIKIDLSYFIGDTPWDESAIHEEIASLLFRINLSTKDLIDVEVIQYRCGTSYKYPPNTHILDNFVVSRESGSLAFICVMRVLMGILSVNRI